MLVVLFSDTWLATDKGAAPDMQWMGMQQGMDGFMGPPAAFNPCWPGMQPAMDGFMGPFGGNMPFNNMGYGLGPMDMPFGNVMPPDPFGNVMRPDPFGAQGFMMPPMFPPPQRYISYFLFFRKYL